MQRLIRIFICSFFVINSLLGNSSIWATDLLLPKPDLPRLKSSSNLPVLQGIKVNPNNPFAFDFVVNPDPTRRQPGDRSAVKAPEGNNRLLSEEEIKTQSTKLIKYFLASLTIPEDDLWVNLSPYEKGRIVPESFGQTEMGRDLLAQDYILKQATANLMHPDSETGKAFWKRVYEKAAAAGLKNIPVSTYNKVWIMPDQATVYENPKVQAAYVVQSSLKVMLEEDYLSKQKNLRQPGDMLTKSTCPHAGCQTSDLSNMKAPEGTNRSLTMSSPNAMQSLSSPNVSIGDPQLTSSATQIIRDIIIPELTKEVNTGTSFAQLRQVYNALILATWYKKKIKASILAKVYIDQKKIKGLEYNQRQPGDFLAQAGGSEVIGLPAAPGEDAEKKAPPRGDGWGEDKTNTSLTGPASLNDVETIYQQYLQAFKKGAYNFIKEERDLVSGQMIPRKYFSGGMKIGKLEGAMTVTKDSSMLTYQSDGAMTVSVQLDNLRGDLIRNEDVAVIENETVRIEVPSHLMGQDGITQELAQRILEQASAPQKEKWFGRSVIVDLPPDKQFEGIQVIRIKGATFNGGRPRAQRYVTDTESSVQEPIVKMVIKDGVVRIEENEGNPQGTMTLKRALNEYRMSKAIQAAGIPTAKILGIGQFKLDEFQKMPSGFLIFGEENKNIEQRLGYKIRDGLVLGKNHRFNPGVYYKDFRHGVRQSAQLLRRLHDAGFTHGQPHLAQFAYFDNQVDKIYDFTSALIARELTREEFVFRVLIDVVLFTRAVHRQAEIDDERLSNLRAVLKDNIKRVYPEILQGYFTPEELVTLNRADLSTESIKDIFVNMLQPGALKGKNIVDIISSAEDYSSTRAIIRIANKIYDKSMISKEAKDRVKKNLRVDFGNTLNIFRPYDDDPLDEKRIKIINSDLYEYESFKPYLVPLWKFDIKQGLPVYFNERFDRHNEPVFVVMEELVEYLKQKGFSARLLIAFDQNFTGMNDDLRIDAMAIKHGRMDSKQEVIAAISEWLDQAMASSSIDMRRNFISQVSSNLDKQVLSSKPTFNLDWHPFRFEEDGKVNVENFAKSYPRHIEIWFFNEETMTDKFRIGVEKRFEDYKPLVMVKSLVEFLKSKDIHARPLIGRVNSHVVRSGDSNNNWIKALAITVEEGVNRDDLMNEIQIWLRDQAMRGTYDGVEPTLDEFRSKLLDWLQEQKKKGRSLREIDIELGDLLKGKVLGFPLSVHESIIYFEVLGIRRKKAIGISRFRFSKHLLSNLLLESISTEGLFANLVTINGRIQNGDEIHRPLLLAAIKKEFEIPPSLRDDHQLLNVINEYLMEKLHENFEAVFQIIYDKTYSTRMTTYSGRLIESNTAIASIAEELTRKPDNKPLIIFDIGVGATREGPVETNALALELNKRKINARILAIDNKIPAFRADVDSSILKGVLFLDKDGRILSWESESAYETGESLQESKTNKVKYLSEIAASLRKYGYHKDVVEIEVSPLERFEREYPGLEFVEGNLFKLDLEPRLVGQQADLVRIANLIFPHYGPDGVRAALGNLLPYVKEGGMVFISTNASNFIQSEDVLVYSKINGKFIFSHYAFGHDISNREFGALFGLYEREKEYVSPANRSSRFLLDVMQKDPRFAELQKYYERANEVKSKEEYENLRREFIEIGSGLLKILPDQLNFLANESVSDPKRKDVVAFVHGGLIFIDLLKLKDSTNKDVSDFANRLIMSIRTQGIVTSVSKDVAMRSDRITKQNDVNGGIDFNPNAISMDIKKDQALSAGEAAGVNVNIDPQMIESLRSSTGFRPVIINIKPLTDLKSFLDITSMLNDGVLK